MAFWGYSDPDTMSANKEGFLTVEFSPGEFETIEPETIRDAYDDWVGLLQLFNDIDIKVVELPYKMYKEMPVKMMQAFRVYKNLTIESINANMRKK